MNSYVIARIEGQPDWNIIPSFSVDNILWLPDVGVRLQLKNHKRFFHFRSAKTQDGWEIFYEIPASFVQLFVPNFALKPGSEIRANCYKCGDLTPKPHYLSWNPSTSPNPDFHRPQDFGFMTLA